METARLRSRGRVHGEGPVVLACEVKALMTLPPRLSNKRIWLPRRQTQAHLRACLTYNSRTSRARHCQHPHPPLHSYPTHQYSGGNQTTMAPKPPKITPTAESQPLTMPTSRE